MPLRELRSFQPGDVVRLDGRVEMLKIISTGDMGTTVRPLAKHTRDFTGFDGRDYRRVQFKALRKPITYAGSALAYLVKGATDATD